MFVILKVFFFLEAKYIDIFSSIFHAELEKKKVYFKTVETTTTEVVVMAGSGVCLKTFHRRWSCRLDYVSVGSRNTAVLAEGIKGRPSAG